MPWTMWSTDADKNAAAAGAGCGSKMRRTSEEDGLMEMVEKI